MLNFIVFIDMLCRRVDAVKTSTAVPSPPKHVATAADLRLRLVIAAIVVAALCARLAAVARGSVRRVALRTACVVRDRVQARQGRFSMTRCAAGWGRNAGRAVRAVARRATPLHGGVVPLGFARVARSARCAGCPRSAVRLVATGALLVTLRRARVFGRVARCAWRRRGGLVCGGAVARGAIAVSSVRRRERHLLCVARAAVHL
jgi:hypothetical protein